jgi:uncharacterized membrane protein
MNEGLSWDMLEIIKVKFHSVQTFAQFKRLSVGQAVLLASPAQSFFISGPTGP